MDQVARHGTVSDVAEWKILKIMCAPNVAESGKGYQRYEWFLADALRDFFAKSGRSFKITEQWQLRDHRGHIWYFDLLVSVRGESSSGISQIIEVDGADHKRQKRYSGPGGGYTRDYDKEWELFSVQKYHKSGYFLTRVTNEDCRMRVVRATAERLGNEIIKKADTWIG